MKKWADFYETDFYETDFYKTCYKDLPKGIGAFRNITASKRALAVDPLWFHKAIL
jgi:hypothetical protein